MANDLRREKHGRMTTAIIGKSRGRWWFEVTGVRRVLQTAPMVDKDTAAERSLDLPRKPCRTKELC